MSREETFMTMFDKHADDVFCYCFLHLQNRTQALKLTQWVFTTSWVRLPQERKLNVKVLYDKLDALMEAESRGKKPFISSLLASS